MLRQISVATDGTVWGVNAKGKLYRRKDADSDWIRMISNSNVVFEAVSAGRRTNIWALDKNGDIYYCNDARNSRLGPIGGNGGSGHISGGWVIDGGWGYGGGGMGWYFQGDYDGMLYHHSDGGGGCGGGSCGGNLTQSKAGGGGYSWINAAYISKEF